MKELTLAEYKTEVLQALATGKKTALNFLVDGQMKELSDGMPPEALAQQVIDAVFALMAKTCFPELEEEIQKDAV